MFDYTMACRPDFSFLTVEIPADQKLRVEASAMATMTTNVAMKSRLKGGMGRLFTGESLFINEFSTNDGRSGEIGIAPAPPGDIAHVLLAAGESIFLQNSAYLACGPQVILETKWQGFVKGFFSGENLFLIRCSGEGDLWFNTYGALIEIEVRGGYVVDTGHLVAFTEGLSYQIGKVGGYKSLFFSGEGLVCKFTGEGKLWLQTRLASALSAWARSHR